MNVSGLIASIALILLGVGLLIGGFLLGDGAIFPLGIYGTLSLAIGIYMLTHLNQEDAIEPRRDQ